MRHSSLPAVGDDMDDPFMVAPPQPAKRGNDGRGKYDRSDGKGTRLAWKPYVQRHMEMVTTGDLSAIVKRVQCSKDCPQHGKCVEMIGTIRALKTCAAESFGDAALLQQWDQITPNHAATAAWFALAHAGRLVDATGKVTGVRLKIDDQLVCQPAWAGMRGIPPTTASSILRSVYAGEMMWNDGTIRTLQSATRKLSGTLTNAAAIWWKTRLGYYEMITKRGLILHPRDISWECEYSDEFVPEMRLLGHPWKLPSDKRSASEDDDGVGSLTTWYRGRDEALQLLAFEKLGPGSKAFEFKSRAKHSAYKECADCQEKRLAKRAAIRRRAPPDEIARLDLDLVDHLQWMYKQRMKLEQITQMAGHEVNL